MKVLLILIKTPSFVFVSGAVICSKLGSIASTSHQINLASFETKDAKTSDFLFKTKVKHQTTACGLAGSVMPVGRDSIAAGRGL